jgi:PEP-CTERM motif
MKIIIAVMSIASLATGAATAQNLLVNGNFNDPASTAAPTGWSTWDTGSGSWENHEILTSSVLIDTADGGAGAPNNTGIYDGSYQMTLGNNTGSNWEGVYQVVAGTAGLTYTLSVDAGAQGWWWPNGYANLDFLDGSGNQISQAQIVTTTSISGFNVGVPYQNFTESAIAPAGTAQVKVELEEYGGGSAWFDNALLTTVPEPTTLALLAASGVGLLGWRRFRRN